VARVAGAASVALALGLAAGPAPPLPSPPPLAALAALAARAEPAPADSDAAASLAVAERAFSAASVEKGMREAFLAYLADDAVIFRPLAVNGRESWRAREASPATLIWEPSMAEVSGAGDLGWTTGPWELRPPADSGGAPRRAEDVAHGHFVSVWARQADGAWRVVLDLGGSHAALARGVGSGDFTAGPVHTWAAGVRKSPKSRADLAGIDRGFARDAKKRGAGALDAWATADLRFQREGEFPAAGRDSAKRALATVADLVRLLPQGSRVSASDDLGYSYGIAERLAPRGESPDSSVYLHIWRREADRQWRIAMMVERPLRPR